MNSDIKLHEVYALDNETLESVSGGASPYPFPHKTKNNSICPKCGKKIQTCVCEYVDGMGLQMITHCWDCNVHWIYEQFYESQEVTYTFVDGDFMNDNGIHVISKPF